MREEVLEYRLAGASVDATVSITPDESPSRPPWLLVAGSLIGHRYEVRSVLGTGGSATVYHVHDRQLRRDVALKVLRPARQTPRGLARLRREVTIAREVESPRLLRIYDVGASSGLVHVSMELMTGGALADRLQSGPIAVEETIRIADQILEGLAALHARDVVHRDVKPGNVLLTPEGGVKLGDFGLARRLESAESVLTVGEGVLGTLGYLAPEQVRGEDATPRSDLYALGIVLYECLTGEHPWPRRQGLGRVAARLERRAPDLRLKLHEAPAWLARFVSRLLEPSPQDRFVDAGAALEVFRRRRVTNPRLRRWAAMLGLAILSLVTLGRLWRPGPPGAPTLSGHSYCDVHPPPRTAAVQLRWSAARRARVYDVYRDGQLYSPGIEGTSFRNNLNVEAASAYTYVVEAHNAYGGRASNAIRIAVPVEVCP